MCRFTVYTDLVYSRKTCRSSKGTVIVFFISSMLPPPYYIYPLYRLAGPMQKGAKKIPHSRKDESGGEKGEYNFLSLLPEK